ncbi:hypothetical protein SLA2020_525270 [Shorea laevis]
MEAIDSEGKGLEDLLEILKESYLGQLETFTHIFIITPNEFGPNGNDKKELAPYEETNNKVNIRLIIGLYRNLAPTTIVKEANTSKKASHGETESKSSLQD